MIISPDPYPENLPENSSVAARMAAILLAIVMTFTFLNISAQTKPVNKSTVSSSDTATFASGCFWCTEAVFQDLNGVLSVASGYSGGSVKNPSYRDVCSGNTGHAEACQVIYDPMVISFTDLLEVFWKTHDPTTLNRQGHDEGTQYRSAIFYHNEIQRLTADKYKKELNASKAFSSPIVTEITAYKNFYIAENYHQDYFNLHGEEPYCQFVIQPKVDKFKKVFHDKLKK